MSDDTFIREVNEEIRQARIKHYWERLGPLVILAVILIILGVAAYVGYNHWQKTRAQASGDEFAQALQLANDGKSDEALTAFEALEKSGTGAYPELARMRAATALAEKSDFEGAIREFDRVAADQAVPQSLRDMATLRAALLLVDHGDQAQVASRLEALAVDTNSFRHSARELLGLSAWKAGQSVDALALFEQLSDDMTAPSNLRQRAMVMRDLIRGSGAAK